MHADIAATLLEARNTRVSIQPLTETYPDLRPEDAYAIQAAWLERELGNGGKLAGRKVGLTSVAMQTQLGVDQPDYGFLLQTMLVPSGGTLQRGNLLQPRVEPEIAFWLGQELRGPGVTAEQALAATRSFSAALEIVDSRIANWKIKLADTIADNGSSAHAVVGEQVAAPARFDLAAEPVKLKRNGEVVGEGTGAAVLGHPAEAVAWLANTLGQFGQALAPGQLILPGAMCASVFAESGDTFEAEFPHLGVVTIHFA